MAKEKKTNAMRLLDKEKITYDTLSYAYDEEHLDGIHASEEIGYPPEQVYKTLVTHSSNQVVVALIPVDKSLDLKALAAASGQKKLEMLPLKEIVAITGYQRGGCSPLAMKKDYPTFIDHAVLLQERIAISAGHRGQQIVIVPADLIAVRKMQVLPLTMD